jgi:hypothetical protein
MKEKRGQWNLKKYILLIDLLSAFRKDANFWDAKRRNFVEVSKENVVRIVQTEEGGNHNTFPEIFLRFYQTTRRHVLKITLMFFYSCCFLILSGWLINSITFYRFRWSTFWRYS